VKIEWTSETLQEVKYFIKITKQEEHWIDWEMYSVSQWHQNHSYEEEWGELVIHGSTKWDGCSDFIFNEDGIHFCELYEWKDFGRALEWMYRTIYGMIEARDGELE